MDDRLADVLTGALRPILTDLGPAVLVLADPPDDPTPWWPHEGDSTHRHLIVRDLARPAPHVGPSSGSRAAISLAFDAVLVVPPCSPSHASSVDAAERVALVAARRALCPGGTALLLDRDPTRRPAAELAGWFHEAGLGQLEIAELDGTARLFRAVRPR